MSEARCCWCGFGLVEAGGVYWCSGSEGCRTRQAEYGLATADKKGGHVRYLYVPTPKQAEFHAATRKVRRLLYGGQAGPGKSHALRWGLYRDCATIPNLNCLLLRRTFQQLEQTHLGEMVREQKVIGAQYMAGDKVMKFPNGSVIRAGHCETVSDAQNYLSTEYDRVAFDELVTFDRDMALEIMSRARTSKAAVKAAGDAQVWAGTNPGGRGALWVKEFFIERTVDRGEFPSYRPERYGFVEASLEDNPYISAEYRRDLEDLPEMRKRQLLYGDWNAFEGQFFSEFRAGVHVADLPVVDGVEHFASLDWGYSAPGVCLWWACVPDGRYHIRREYKFKGESAESVATMIKAINKELGVRLRYLACDPAMWQKTGAGRGESIAETLIRRGLPARSSDNDRFNGWLRVHELLRLDAEQRPWLTIAPSCTYLVRTVPAMVQDKNDPEDLDSAKDDHAVDALRYGAMSRPAPTRVVVNTEPPVGTWGWYEQHDRNSHKTGALA